MELEKEILNNNQNNLLESLFNHPSLGMIRITSEGIPVLANRTILKFLSLESFTELIELYNQSESFRNNFNTHKYFKYINQEIKNNYLETEWINKNGKVVFFKEFVSPVYKVSGFPDYFDCIIEDQTDKKIVEQLIKNCQTRDFQILKALPDILFIVSSDGTLLDSKFNSHSSFFKNPALLIGRKITSVFPKTVSEKLSEAIKHTLQTNQLSSVEFSVISEDEEIFYEARIVVNSDNQALMLLRDVTPQKEAEAQLRKVTEDLKQANASKDKFFSIIAHDLRTPLIGLIGYAEILSEDIDELELSEIKEYSKNIVDISRQTIKLLSNLLEWSRLQTGKIQFNPSDVKIYSIVENIFQLLKSNAQHKEIELINSTNMNHIAYADENMIYSVFNNLISNAIKFTRTGGKIEVSSEQKGEEIIVSVKDNGVGIDEENLKNLFELDKSFTTPGTENEKGSGLGIILCRDFIKKHGGRIWVNSKVGEGTTFFFTLPVFH
ncbi:MAG: PAS domain S-box protein [Ignavibacterium sp.]|jgi:PAS domain S-box-containing protein|uniref:sensor histidine kinase n=1 Tax=Ignavibacterium sp. TaxID=2651167 RepID=UPI003299EE6A